MATKESKIMGKRLLSAYISSVLSITLVLALVGLAALLLVNGKNVSDYFKEHMRVAVIFDQKASEDQCRRFAASLQSKEYARDVEYVSREQGIKEMEELLGKDFLTVFDSAPVPVSLNLSLKADYVTGGQVDSIINVIRSSPVVDDVVWQQSLIEALNSNLRTISLFLGGFIAILLAVSIMMIGNTVRLSLYGKRFSINTMRLVGATKNFIRGPFMVESVFQGIIAALLAMVFLLGVLIFIKSRFAQLFTVFQMRELLSSFGIMAAAGVLICLFTTYLVVGHIVSLKKEELYL